MDNDSEANSVAIIGMAGRFPGAGNIRQFWDNLCQGVESISQFTEEELKVSGISDRLANHPNYVKARGVLDGIEDFDAKFFDFTSREAQIADPQHRLFLECSWEALENAGYCSYTYPGSIGVYGGLGMNSYFLNNIHPDQLLKETLGEYLLQISNEKDFMATRVSYKLNLRGPSLNIQTACSTSLVSVCVACNHLLSYQCDMALAGGVSIVVPQKKGYQYQEGMIFSPDGRCRPFDAGTKGTVPGNGVGIVVLKRLHDAIADRDHIYAVIKGYGLNNDGMEKIGYSAPSVAGQAEAISTAISMAEINPETIGYVEAHGTGTFLGDPIEIKALTQAFQAFTQKKEYCAIGSVKSNVGHLIEAAGVTGLLKTALCLFHQQIPPSLQFSTPNPLIDFFNSPFYINTSLKKWNSGAAPRRACVSSFGVGGTNAHVVLEEKPRQPPSSPSRLYQLILLSAKTPTALNALSVRLGRHLQETPFVPLADVAYTLQVGRKALDERQMLICSNKEEATSLLLSSDQGLGKVIQAKAISNEPNITFVLADHDSPYINMGKGLYQAEPAFRQTIDLCSALLNIELEVDIRHILYPSSDQNTLAKKQIALPAFGQCALFITQYALAKLWQEWGINPQSMICQRVGEYVAACLAGVISIEDALKLVAKRGNLMQNRENCLVSSVSLTTASPTTWSNETAYGNLFKEIKLMPPKIPYFSHLTGSWIRPDEAVSPSYWAQLMQNAISSSPDIQEMMNESNRVFIEIGLEECSEGFFKQKGASNNAKALVVSSLLSENQFKDDSETMLFALGQLWLLGTKVDWNSFYQFEQRFRTPLPSYPFEKKRFWIDPQQEMSTQNKRSNSFNETIVTASTKDIEKSLLVIWKDLLGFDSIELNDDFFKLGGDSLLAIQMACRIQESFNLPLQFQTLIEHPTIVQLAKAILEKLRDDKSKETERGLSSILVKLKEGTGNNPLFLIHPIGGQVFCYRHFAECMKYEGPIIGINAPQVAAKTESSVKSIEEMASYYLNAIRLIQPNGPYYLLGASFGGVVAFEMARQLKSSGQCINLLALLDIIRPDAAPYPINSNADMIAILIELFEGKSLPSRLLESLSKEDQTQMLLNSMGMGLLPLDEQQKIFEQIKIHWQALLSYTPKPYDGKIVFFQASQRSIRHKDISLGATWQKLATQGVEIHEVPGNHLTMIMHPNVEALVNLIVDRGIMDPKN